MFSATPTDVLELAQGSPLVALVGGGGKTSTMYVLARFWAAQGLRVCIATTTRIEQPPAYAIDRLCLFDRDGSFPECFLGPMAPRAGQIVCIAPSAATVADPSGGQCRTKLSSVLPDLPLKLLRTGVFDRVVVEADGARRLPFKAPAAHEPVLPLASAQYPLTVIGVTGLDVLGEPLTEANVFRPELVAALSGCPIGGALQPAHIAKVMLSPAGYRKDVNADDIDAGATIPAHATRYSLLLNKLDVCDVSLLPQVTQLVHLLNTGVNGLPGCPNCAVASLATFFKADTKR
jgi:probable selenium-dependent hydroxylase accessory protein YqeC